MHEESIALTKGPFVLGKTGLFSLPGLTKWSSYIPILSTQK